MDSANIIDTPIHLIITSMSEETQKKPALDQILNEWDIDAKWDPSDPGTAMARIPILHAKYLHYLRRHKATASILEDQLVRERHLKTEYYSGRLDQDHLKKYGLVPFKLVLKQEVKEYVESDDKVLELNLKKSAHEQVVELCESIMKELNNRTWQLSGYMKWQQFLRGQD